MVEGGKIDWACHANDATASILNTISFDESVKKAIAFAKKHPEDTLIVVTGDHECGGLTLGFAGTKYGSHYEILGQQKVSFQKFTDEIIPDFKEQGGNFRAMQSIISKNFGLKFSGDSKKDALVLVDFEIAELKTAFDRTMADGGNVNGAEYIMYGEYAPLAVSITHILNQKAGLGWTSYKHTGVPVSTSAMGVGAESFNGSYDNIDIATKIMSVMGLKAKPQYAKSASTHVAAN